MGVLSNLDPKRVFDYFEELCSVPHGSGNTKQISDLCASFAKRIGLNYVQDDLNNLVIYKPAAKGYEDHEPVILQGHMDMVCAKTADCTKDMSKEGLDLYIENGYVRARNTSLGGDDGIAVAMILALLEDPNLKAPAIEAVFTVDEEVGMDGAAGLDMKLLSAKRMLNLDSEEEGVFTVSCAGGLRADCFIPSKADDDKLPEGYTPYVIHINGLIGGHSGVEIHKGRQNAIKLIAHVLTEVGKSGIEYRLTMLNGGKFDNVICNETEAGILIKDADRKSFEEIIAKFRKSFKSDFAVSDPGVNVTAQEINASSLRQYVEKGLFSVHSKEDSYRMTDALEELPQGVIKMSTDVEGLVQTSLNTGMVRLTEEGLKFTVSVRSSVREEKYEIVDILRNICEKHSGRISTHGDYPGWAYKKDSTVREILSETYRRQTGQDPVITAIHAGLECGLFADAIPDFDCVSIGPELKDIHSVGEKLGISSVHRLYRLVRSFLERM